MHHVSVPRRLVAVLAGAFLAASAAGAFAQSVPTTPMTASEEVSPKILAAQIDVTCDTMVQQQKLITPVHLVLTSSTWAVVKDANLIAADRTSATATYVDVWKQNGKYVWVHAHRFTQAGSQRATQLCFRVDGTLARAKQAATIPSLDAAEAVRAYFYTNGKIAAKVGVFEENDPSIAKAVTALPYYANLP
jgi:hypothetical protein